MRTGPYLLIIEAAEKPSGEAKVYGTVCSDNQPVTCQSDAGCAGFCRGTGPGRNDAGAIALAMVYLATNGTALWIDSWIPRRTIVDSPGEDWHRTRFGAPPPNADVGPASLNTILNQSAAQHGLVAGYVMAAELKARTYFQNTNVLAYTTVALHDDDILEDLVNVFDKDPVQLDRPPTLDARLTERFKASRAKASFNPALALLADLQIAFMSVGIDDLVNRRVEVVKLVVPLQGLTRPRVFVSRARGPTCCRVSSSCTSSNGWWCWMWSS